MYVDKPMRYFLDRLTSASPEPGGGAAAALAGSLAAALVGMVANRTKGKKGYEAVQEAVAALLDQAEALRTDLQRLLQEDTEAFSAVAEAYRLPKETEEQKRERSARIQEALKGAATQVPLAVCEKALEVGRLSRTAAEIGNVQAVSDAGVAVLLAEAAAQAAAMNVKINLNSIRDTDFTGPTWTRVQEILKELAGLRETVVAATYEKMG